MASTSPILKLSLATLTLLNLLPPCTTSFLSNIPPSPPPNHHHHHRLHTTQTRLHSLQRSGDSFLSLSDHSSTPTSDAFRSIGDALHSAHAALAVEWDDVASALHAASESFDALSRTHRDGGDIRRSELYGTVARELGDASEITGCLSIGPPAAVPNFEAVGVCLVELARLEEDGAAGSLREAAEGFSGLVQGIV